MTIAIFPNVAELQALTDFIAQRGAPFTIRLFKNNFTPDQTSAKANFTEADFTGYTPVSWAVGTPFEGADNKAHINPATAFFSGPTDLVPQTVYGWYVTWPNGSAEVFLCALFVGGPITLSSPADTITFNLDFTMFDFNQ